MALSEETGGGLSLFTCYSHDKGSNHGKGQADCSETQGTVLCVSGTGVNGGTLRSSTAYTYANKTNYLTGVQHFSPLGTQAIGYTYGNMAVGEMPDQIYKVSWNGQEKVNYAYDALGRLSNKKVLTGNGALDTVYTYKDIGGNRTTTLVQSVRNALGTYTYTYDAVGNITGISDGINTTSYAYDSLNQLVRENDQRAGKTYTYSYQNGNLAERREYAYTTGALGEVLDTKTWSYTDSTWSDLLTSFNGKTITYDGIGNPLTIGSKTLAWSGRQLQSIADGENAYSYRYNTDGQRISKTVNGATTEYFYNGEILAGQKTGNTTLVFMYDNNGDAFGFTYNGASYYYIRNAQNDVVAIADSSRNVVAKYVYDAWGNVVAVTDASGNEIADTSNIGFINPIRYRSYYFDTETGLYYVSSRYYNPEICRWINADSITDGGAGVLGNNLFMYAANNPVNNSDPSGHWIIKNAIKWIAKNVVKPVVKKVQKALSKVKATYSRGINISGSPSAFSFNLQAGVSIDTKGNVAIQGNFSGGVTGGSPGVSITAYQAVTSAPNIKKLEGTGYQIGGSAGVPVYGVPIAAGGDFNIIPDTELNTTYYGSTTNVGFGTPGGEFHVEWGETATWNQTQFNVFDVAKGIYVKIMEW